jgi:HD-like signal output (HDOD) protein
MINNQAGTKSDGTPELAGHGITIPSQPRVLTEIDSLTRQASVSIKDIASLIGKDPGIVAGIFKIANSSALGLSRRIETIESAISVMGISQLTNVIKSIAIRQSLAGSSPAYEVFWERANEIAQIAAAIAVSRGSVIDITKDQAYMAALFHDCGVPILMQKFPDYCKAFRSSKSSPWPNLASEDAALDTDHCVIGYLVSKQWALPELIQQAIRYHHEQVASTNPASTIVALLQLSTHFYCVQHRLNDEPEWISNQDSILEEVGLNIDGLTEFSEEILDRLNG